LGEIGFSVNKIDTRSFPDWCRTGVKFSDGVDVKTVELFFCLI
jgi:hypothetical protein